MVNADVPLCPCEECGKFQLIALLVVGLSVMGNVSENVNVSLIMPYAKCELGFTITEQGLLNSAGFLGILISAHFWAFLADTWGRQRVIFVALAGSSLFGIVSAFSTTTLMLLIFRFIVGILWVQKLRTLIALFTAKIRIV